MALLDLALSNFQWYMKVGVDSRLKVIFELKNNTWDDAVKLKSGDNLLEMPGTLHLIAADSEVIGNEKMGHLCFMEAYSGSSDGVLPPMPNRFSVEVLVLRDDLVHLIEAEKSGYGAKSVNVAIPEGIEYGVLPDGSDMVWKADGNSVPVESLSFGYEADRATEEAETLFDTPDITGDSADALGTNDALAALNANLTTGGIWITALLGLIFIVLIAK